MADPVFLGFCLERGSPCAAKVVQKVSGDHAPATTIYLMPLLCIWRWLLSFMACAGALVLLSVLTAVTVARDPVGRVIVAPVTVA